MAAGGDLSLAITRPSVLFLRTEYDHNDFFTGPEMARTLEKVSRVAHTVLREVGSVEQIQFAISSCEKAPDAIVFLCHGNPDYLLLGKETYFDEESITEEFFSTVPEETTITFLSCSSSTVAERVSSLTRRAIFAPIYDITEEEYIVNPYFPSASPYPILLDHSFIHNSPASPTVHPVPEGTRISEIASYVTGMETALVSYIEWLNDESFEELKAALPIITQDRAFEPCYITRIAEDFIPLEKESTEALLHYFKQHAEHLKLLDPEYISDSLVSVDSLNERGWKLLDTLTPLLVERGAYHHISKWIRVVDHYTTEEGKIHDEDLIVAIEVYLKSRKEFTDSNIKIFECIDSFVSSFCSFESVQKALEFISQFFDDVESPLIDYRLLSTLNSCSEEKLNELMLAFEAIMHNIPCIDKTDDLLSSLLQALSEVEIENIEDLYLHLYRKYREDAREAIPLGEIVDEAFEYMVRAS